MVWHPGHAYGQDLRDKDKRISEAQQRRNHRIAKMRARIKHVSAGLTQMGG